MKHYYAHHLRLEELFIENSNSDNTERRRTNAALDLPRKWELLHFQPLHFTETKWGENMDALTFVFY